MRFNLFYLCRKAFCTNRGGAHTYTCHLARMLKHYGHEVYIFKVGKKTESSPRNFSEDGRLKYQNLSLSDAKMLKHHGTNILCHWDTSDPFTLYDVLSSDMIVVFHDLNCWPGGSLKVLHNADPRVICIREIMLERVPVSFKRFVPHPYIQDIMSSKRYEEEHRRRGAISICRITKAKNIEMILEANKLGAGIKMYGSSADRMYIHHTLEKKYGDVFAESYVGPFEDVTGAELVWTVKPKFVVDLTLFPHDGGGGTQYSFFEAWDGGATLITHADWGLALYSHQVRTPEELVNVVKSDVRLYGEQILKDHSIEKVYPIFMKAVEL